MTEMKQAHAGSELYDKDFFHSITEAAFAYAEVMIPQIKKFIQPRTVIDIGCGAGAWLSAWQKSGAQSILGIDGDYVDSEEFLIDKKYFKSANLEERINLDRKFDLAMTLEVAEHLTPERADSFVEDLTKLSDVILFSAAIPGQGGTNHVNEQFPSYWAMKFLKFGYIAVDCLRPIFWHNQSLSVHYRQNMFIYVNSKELYRYPKLQKYYLEHCDSIIYDAVHPEIWIGKLVAFQNFYNQVQAKQSPPPLQ